MSFGAGIAVGLSCGIGSGIAAGMTKGKVQAGEQIRDYMDVQELTIHDAAGADVDIDAFLADALHDTASDERNRNKYAFALLLLLGLATFGVLVYYSLS